MTFTFLKYDFDGVTLLCCRIRSQTVCFPAENDGLHEVIVEIATNFAAGIDWKSQLLSFNFDFEDRYCHLA